MFSKVTSCTIIGIDGCLVTVETDIRRGLPSFAIVGLPESAVRESRERVSSAIGNSGYEFPLSRITVNLAPADIRKSGTAFDLAIAVGILAATGVVSSGRLHNHVVLGELALDGSLRRVRGVLSMSLEARNAGFACVVVPADNGNEASIVEGLPVVAPADLPETVSYLNSGLVPSKIPSVSNPTITVPVRYEEDLVDIRGQETARRALEIACAGGHNVLMIGPPGSGKTMLARRIPTILPSMTLDERIETTRIHSVAGLLPEGLALVTGRPFRAPHHTISDVGIVGGGNFPRPGEVSLANNGVLFLDELPEFRRGTLEVLRQPLEDGCVNLVRASFSATYPARFMLVAAMNPCPCGYFTDATKTCSCSSTDIQRYLSRISGPLLDRIDIHLDLPSVRVGDLFGKLSGEPSRVVAERVERARQIQLERFERDPRKFCNAHATASESRKLFNIENEALDFLKKAVRRLGLSARALHRIIRVGRTIADLDSDALVKVPHVAEAVQYRTLDRPFWYDTF